MSSSFDEGKDSSSTEETPLLQHSYDSPQSAEGQPCHQSTVEEPGVTDPELIDCIWVVISYVLCCINLYNL